MYLVSLGVNPTGSKGYLELCKAKWDDLKYVNLINPKILKSELYKYIKMKIITIILPLIILSKL